MANVHLSYTEWAELTGDSGLTNWVKYNWLSEDGLPFHSILGRQYDLEEVTTETAGKQYINIGNGHFVRRNRTTSSIIPYRFNLPLDSAHKYFCIVMFDKPVSNLNMYNYNATGSANTPFAKYSLTNGICGTITNVTKLDTIHIWQGNDDMPIDIMVKYAVYVDMTANGLEDLDAETMYNKYKDVFEKVAQEVIPL